VIILRDKLSPGSAIILKHSDDVNWNNRLPTLNLGVIMIHSTKKYTHRQPFSGPLSGTTQVSRHQKGKTNLDFTEARDSKWQWHQLGHMQVCTALQTDNHASTPSLNTRFLQAGCPSCRPTNNVKALKAFNIQHSIQNKTTKTITGNIH